ncbi:MAG: DUF1998 domain-containing protein [Candidatus Eisenbacteria bacterium]|nr:DUF1998 domain-containing protein [Candidatus Eisenbacteria bacterium]
MTAGNAPPVGGQHPRLGEVRPSQLLYSSGVGAIIDLPRLSVMVMGLDDWDESRTRSLPEPRLLAAVREQLGAQVRDLRLPPTPEVAMSRPRAGSPESRVGVPVAPFPRWLCCTRCRKLAAIGSGLFRLKPDENRPDRTRYEHENCHKGTHSEVLPVRFMAACEHGHLDDFPWQHFVHRGVPGCRGPLELRVTNPSGEASGLQVKCLSCPASRTMAEAFGDDAADALGACSCRRPQLRDYDAGPCASKPRAILLGASNLWVPVVLSALDIPADRDPLDALVEARWAELATLKSLEGVETMRGLLLLRELTPFTDEQIWSSIQARRVEIESGSGTVAPASLRLPEWEAFTSTNPRQLSADFQLRRVETPQSYHGVIERVVLAERLREVRALIGFTRVSPPGEFGEPGDTQARPLAPLTKRPPQWALASEVRGEGLFIQLSEQAIQSWLATDAARQRGGALLAAHRANRERHQQTPLEAGFPGMRFVLLHTLSHALMRQLAVECGYALASVRERIYSRDADEHGPAMAGLLLYTAAPDSEGTLGGLVRLGEPDQLGRLIGAALEEAQLCSSDPLCAEYDAASGHDLHGAACHACLLIPETSCERANRYLDRAVIAPIFGRESGSYFGGGQ